MILTTFIRISSHAAKTKQKLSEEARKSKHANFARRRIFKLKADF
jgi:hypothetical protein